MSEVPIEGAWRGEYEGITLLLGFMDGEILAAVLDTGPYEEVVMHGDPRRFYVIDEEAMTLKMSSAPNAGAAVVEETWHYQFLDWSRLHLVVIGGEGEPTILKMVRERVPCPRPDDDWARFQMNP